MTRQTGNDDPKVVAAINRAIQLDKKNQTSSAVALLSRLTQEFPRAASVHGYLSWFLLQTGKKAKAIKHGRLATELAPNSEKASLVYFHALWKSGRQIQALEEMKRFMAIRPSKEYSTIIKDWKLDVHEVN